MAVGTESQVSEVEHRRLAGNLLESLRILLRGSFRVSHFYRHGIDLVRRQSRNMLQQAGAQMSEVAIGISCRRDTLIHLEDMHIRPGNFFISQFAKHDPGSVASTDRHDEAAARGNRS